jgi:3-hydroxybutyryl-CoA dehydrogenase
MANETVAVLGCGTMGAGIAQAALAAGYAVTLYDISEDALARARARIAGGLSKQGHEGAAERLRTTATLGDLAGATLVIEAAPEQLDLKREMFARVGALCPAPCVIASNTSSLPIAALAASCPQPMRVAGMHFFNPVHRMALVEVVRTDLTDDVTAARLLDFVRALGKTAVQARDTPGFVVNRVARPFYGEALRLLGDGLATVAAIDQALVQAGGFPLGPFGLMDLVGVDVNFAVTRSMHDQSFGEPRYRPHQIQQQLVLSGRLGRKTGRGFYEYGDQGSGGGGQEVARNAAGINTATPGPRPLTAGSVLIGSGTWAPGLADLCTAAGLAIVEDLPYDDPSSIGAAFVAAGRGEGAADQLMILDRQLPAATPIFAQCADMAASDLAALLEHPERLIGFDGLFAEGALTLAATPVLGDSARAAADALARAAGRTPVWMADGPALIVPRVVAMLANEAAFALGEGVADADTIDMAMRLGANHPVGPLARAAALGYDKVVAILDHLRAEYGEERYRVAPALRRAARLGRM